MKSQEIQIPNEEVHRKAYTCPEIIHELELETRAGSPLGLPDPLNLEDPAP
jgi:hypothetical protein